METQINPGSQNQDLSKNTTDFKKVVEESKQALATTTITPKRGPGRPPKQRPIQEPHVTAPAPTEGPRPAPVPAPDISKFLKQPIIMLSKAPAVKYKVPELQFSDDEAAACAEALNNVVQAFVPDVGQMDPKTAAVVSAVAVFGAVGFQKYQIYRDNIKMAPPPPKESEVQAEIKTNQQSAGIPAGDYFATKVS